MKIMYKSLIAAVLLSVSALAQATTIDFINLGGANYDPFPSPYSQDGYSVTVVSGEWNVAKMYGDIPNMFTNTGGTVSVTANDSSLFNFTGLDTASSLISFTGLLNGSTVFSETYTGSTSWHYQGSLYGNTAIDELLISINQSGLGQNIDNITVNAVPVPAAVWLFGTGLVALAGVARRKAA